MPVKLVCLDKQIIIVSVNMLLCLYLRLSAAVKLHQFRRAFKTFWHSPRLCNEKFLLFQPHQSQTTPA